MVTNYGSFIASDNFNEFVFIRPEEPSTLFFQQGAVTHGRFNGVVMEDVLEALIARLKHFNQGDWVCEENTEAIHALETALEALMSRQARRMEETRGEVPALDKNVVRSDLEEITRSHTRLFEVRRKMVDHELGKEKEHDSFFKDFQASTEYLAKAKLESMFYNQKEYTLYFSLLEKAGDYDEKSSAGEYWVVREDGEKLLFSREEIVDNYLAFLSNPVYSSGIKSEVRAQYLKDYVDIELAYEIVKRDPELLLELHEFHEAIQEAIHGYTVIFFPDYDQKALVLGDKAYGDTLRSILRELVVESDVTHEVVINETLIEEKLALLTDFERMLKTSDQRLRLKLNKVLRDTDVTVDYWSDSTIVLSSEMDKVESMRKILSQLTKLDVAIYDRGSSLIKEGQGDLLVYEVLLFNNYVFKPYQETVEIVPYVKRFTSLTDGRSIVESPLYEDSVVASQDQAKSLVKPSSGLTYPHGFNQRLVNRTLNKVRELLNEHVDATTAYVDDAIAYLDTLPSRVFKDALDTPEDVLAIHNILISLSSISEETLKANDGLDAMTLFIDLVIPLENRSLFLTTFEEVL